MIGGLRNLTVFSGMEGGVARVKADEDDDDGLEVVEGGQVDGADGEEAVQHQQIRIRQVRAEDHVQIVKLFQVRITKILHSYILILK